MIVGLIYARGRNSAFGFEGRLPWNVPEDLAMFKKTTQGNAVIMGKKTWDSLPENRRPLPGRINIIVTSQELQSNYAVGVYFVKSIETALITAKTLKVKQAWFIGGADIIKEAQKRATVAIVTSVMYDGEYDVSAPVLDSKTWILKSVHLPCKKRLKGHGYAIQHWLPR